MLKREGMDCAQVLADFSAVFFIFVALIFVTKHCQIQKENHENKSQLSTGQSTAQVRTGCGEPTFPFPFSAFSFFLPIQ